ncbi:MAG: hypothetical protein HC765_11815 [Brachymonas sp.]|nr:hypothetical protein [Brachymonas sp.]
MNLLTPSTRTLMPSPLHASEPRNPAEHEIKRLIEESLQNGQTTEYADAASLVQELRRDMRLRHSKRA